MSDPWFRMHANIADKPVVWRLATALEIPHAQAVGHLAMFWGKASQLAPHGDVSRTPDALLEAWAGWQGERGAFARWLRAEHMTDGRINEYDEYSGKLEERREKDRHRKAEFLRKSRGVPAEVTRSSSDTIRDETIRDELPLVALPATAASSARAREEQEPNGPAPPPPPVEDLPDPDPVAEGEVRAGFTAEQLDVLGRLVARIPPSYRAPMLDFFRSLPTPARRVAWTYQLTMILDGERNLKPTPAQVGWALLQMAANGVGDNSKLFTGYLRTAIREDVEHAEKAAAAGAAGPSPEQVRSAPQNWRAARGKALIEAADLIDWIRKRRSAPYPKSLTPEAREALAENPTLARWAQALKAVGGPERVLGGNGDDDKLREQLADSLQALGDRAPAAPAANAHPPPSSP